MIKSTEGRIRTLVLLTVAAGVTAAVFGLLYGRERTARQAMVYERERMAYAVMSERLAVLNNALTAASAGDTAAISRSEGILYGLAAQVNELPLSGYDGKRDREALQSYYRTLQRDLEGMRQGKAGAEQALAAQQKRLTALRRYAALATAVLEHGVGDAAEVLRKERQLSLSSLLPGGEVGSLGRKAENEAHYAVLTSLPEVSEEEARAVAQSVFGQNTRIKLAEEGRAVEEPDTAVRIFRFYCENAYADISANGGKLLKMAFEKRGQAGKAKQDPLPIARDFLAQHGYTELLCTEVKEGSLAVRCTFAPEEAPARTVTVSLLPQGEIFLFDATRYWSDGL